jgi:hypothetical protein
MHAVSGPLHAAAVARALADAPGVLSVRAFGATAHVRVTTALSSPAGMAALLASRGLTETTVAPTEATLEDVFLELAAGSATPAEGA